ncbi:MAG TPA: lipid-A-disaccharide synthase [Phycisphaerae bacterium]|nr:lipid-A-disaccharide synthase [Phycisphaerae bacterium]
MGHPRLFISAGETSGDLHGANLVRALRRLAPQAELVGLGGHRMAAAGLRLLENTSDFGVIGLGFLGSASRYLAILSRADRFIGQWKPDLVVTIDCPGFHFLLASRVRARCIPLLWYIPPQLWAWGPWRVRKLARRFTHVACVLPHEEEFFRSHGVPVTFVGHPVVDHLMRTPLDDDFVRSLRTSPDERLVALLPGSRRQEVPGILARQLAVARTLAERHGPCRFVLALAEAEHRHWTTPLLADSGLEVRTVVGKTHEVQSAADLALVASGTATLETTFYGTPMAVFYNVTWAQWHLLVRWFVGEQPLSLPNVVAGRRIVPEFMRDREPGPEMIKTILRLLVDTPARAEMKSALAEARRSIEKPGAADNAARLALDLVGRAIPPPPAWRPGFAL